jgi:hypothetical protein
MEREGSGLEGRGRRNRTDDEDECRKGGYGNDDHWLGEMHRSAGKRSGGRRRRRRNLRRLEREEATAREGSTRGAAAEIGDGEMAMTATMTTMRAMV